MQNQNLKVNDARKYANLDDYFSQCVFLTWEKLNMLTSPIL